jgi:hypothetical protein
MARWRSLISNLVHRTLAICKLSMTWLLPFVPQRVLSWTANRSLAVHHQLEGLLRRRQSQQAATALRHIVSGRGELLGVHILSWKPPWKDIPLLPCRIPGMLTIAEEQYYTYISQFYRGEGEVVELGTWLGRSTWIIVSNLLKNPAFIQEGKKLHAFDRFVWYSSMDKWVKNLPDFQKPKAGESFEILFRDYIRDIAEHVDVQRADLGCLDSDGDTPELRWANGSIELLFVDCGSTLSVNEAWFAALENSFLPNKTLIVMQDWQNFKSVPYRCWVHTKHFSDLHADRLLLVHEIRGGGVACFLYTSPDPSRWKGIT